MDLNFFLELKESKTVELKLAKNRMPKDVWPTISAFSNTSGGVIYLGIDEGKEGKERIAGVDDAELIVKNFFNDIRNTSKINRPIISDNDVQIITIENKNLIKISIPESSRDAKPTYINGNIGNSYIRIGEGDRLATSEELQGFLLDNSSSHFDSRPNAKNYGVDELDKETIKSFRNELEARSPAYIYKDLDDISLLSKLGCITKNDRGEKVLTNAAVLFFTSFPLINSLFPDCYLDYREAQSWSTKWTNRIVCDDLTWSGNFFDFFLMVSNRIYSTTPKPYRLENGVDVGGKDLQELIREVLANALSNVSLFIPGGISILNDGTNLIVRNSGRMKVGLEQALIGGRSMPRNESILLLLRTLGVADRAGTGIPKIMKIMKDNNYPDPIFQEDDETDSTTLSLIFKAKPQTYGKTDDISLAIREFVRIKGDVGASKAEIMERFGFKSSTAAKLLGDMVKDGMLSTNGKVTTGKMYILK